MWFIAQGQEAADWQVFMSRLIDCANSRDQQLASGEVRRLYRELCAVGRGDAPIGELPIDELLGS